MNDDDKPMSEYPPAPCGECGRPTNREYVEVSELRELIEEWREDWDGSTEASGEFRCAQELEELIDE
jgi:hypothetical protein